MSDIYSILGLSEDVINNFHLQANTVADHQTEKVIIANVRRLKQIEEKMFTGSQIKISQRTVDEVLQKVANCAYKTDHTNEEWSSYDLRVISYFLMKLQGDDNAHAYGLELLDNNWKNLFFNGLIFYVLNGWNLMQPKYREEVCQLIVKRLETYKDNNKKYLLLKDHANFFEESGPLRMATLLKTKKLSLDEAPRLIGYKSSMLSLSYFSDVIVYYLKGAHFEDQELFEDIFSKHDLDRTKKLVFANLVVSADESGNQFEQNQLSKFAHRTLGDISKSVTWTPFTGATDADVSKLKYAKELVNKWYVRKVIEVFFEVCVQDYARKSFWLHYATEGIIKDFRIAGSTLVRQKMQSDDRISTLFSRYFINTNSRSSQTAALILYIKNKVLVEFSDTGALYAYNNTNEVISPFGKGRTHVASVSDLKLTYLYSLVDDSYYSTYYRDEGKMHHRGEWQSRLNRWLYRNVLSSTDITTNDNVDDKYFIAPSLPSQSPAPEYFEREKEEVSPNINKYGKQQTLFDFSDDFEEVINLRFQISSKWILGKFRVVGCSKGFYINVKDKFYHVKDLDAGESYNGNIWVKHPRNGWFNVVHFDSGKTNIIGYVKIEVSRLLYKQDENDKYKEIKL